MKNSDTHIHAMILQEGVDSEAYIRTAIDRGLDEICITDHMPLSISQASDRIPAGRVKEYCRRVRELAEQYADRITIRCGIELDYHPSAVPEIEAVLGEGDFDLRLGSSHLHLFHDARWFASASHLDYAKAMLENVAAAAESGLFDVIPHIDMYKWVFANPKRFPFGQTANSEADSASPSGASFGTAAFAESALDPLIDAALDAIQSHSLLLEINPHFAQAVDDIGQTYPSPYITQKALDRGLSFCFGSDAHVASHVGIMRDELLAHPLYGAALRSTATSRETAAEGSVL